MITKDKILTALRLKCPKCAQGKLLDKFIKTVDHCPNCGEKLGHLRADDGPAWLTIMITGHIVVGFIMWIIEKQYFTYGQEILLAILVTIISSAIFFPPSKALFLTILWHNEQKKDE